ncbi:MAG: SagB/ThcOx family dehydrogenase [Candidatus Schekmanbacteria bacterium]|nr:MAG: SagB/ThcOx family dehydrogenase [Candidatus Schekmanbacteria bacterium]
MSAKEGEKFQEKTKYSRHSLSGGRLDWSKKPPLYKEYPDSKKIKLPPPARDKEESFSNIIMKRRSIRDYSNSPLSLSDLSYLLWATQGITAQIYGYEFRAAPSAGALYPIETYLLVNNVKEIEKGIYHYAVKSHSLETIKEGDFSKKTASAALGQDMVALAPLCFIWTAIFERSKWKYSERAYRYVYLDAGHIAAHLSLAAVSIGLVSCQIAAFFDDEVNELIEVDGKEESTLYMSTVGKPIIPKKL